LGAPSALPPGSHPSASEKPASQDKNSSLLYFIGRGLSYELAKLVLGLELSTMSGRVARYLQVNLFNFVNLHLLMAKILFSVYIEYLTLNYLFSLCV
jgi:hypothetical protein